MVNTELINPIQAREEPSWRVLSTTLSFLADFLKFGDFPKI